MIARLTSIAVLVVAMAAPPRSNGQSGTAAPMIQDLRWRNVGPANMAGRVTDIEAVLANPAIVYVAAASGGLWKSVNAGTTWNPIFTEYGTANMGGKGICKDYGLLARLHLVAGADGKLSARALEAYPLAGMHIRPVPLRGAEAAARIHALNYLGSLLGDAGAMIGRIETLRGHGMDEISFQLAPNGLATMRRIAEEVMPHFK